MASVVAFDTLKFARTLRDKAKFTPEQAEGVADAMAEALQGDIATKSDIAGLRSDIEGLKASTKSDIAGLRSELGALRAEAKSDIAGLRSDIEALRAETRSGIASLRSDLGALRSEVSARIAEAKADILKWVLGAIGFQALAILGAGAALIRLVRP